MFNSGLLRVDGSNDWPKHKETATMPPKPPQWYTHATIGATMAFLLGLALCIWVAPRPQRAQAVSEPIHPSTAPAQP